MKKQEENQEEKIKELDEKLEAVERLICKHSQILSTMDSVLRPIVIEWKEDKEGENIVSRMIVDD